jgi:predicted dehydrogenase
MRPLLNTMSAESTIRWGILGTGSVAHAFARDLRLVPNASLTAVGSRRPESGNAFAKSFGAKNVHGGIEELAGDGEVDVVYVATPHVRHRDDALACLSAGRAVLVEKPFTVTAGEAREVIERARQSATFCMEAMWMRFHPLIQHARSIVDSGELGSIRLITADFGYPASFDPDNRFYDPRMGGGALLDRGVYLLSLAQMFLGAQVDTVGRASIGSTGVDEQESMLLSYANGAQAVLTASLRSRLRNEALIVGTRGQVRIHEPFYAPHRISWTRFEEPVGRIGPVQGSSGGWKAQLRDNPLFRRAFETVGRPVLERIRGKTRSLVHYGPGQGYQFEAAEVMRCLRAGRVESPIVPLDDTLAILETTDRLAHSWTTKETVETL